MPPFCQHSESHGPRRPIALSKFGVRVAQLRELLVAGPLECARHAAIRSGRHPRCRECNRHWREELE
eukprot:5544990-Prymnesium_polylepis.1